VGNNPQTQAQVEQFISIPNQAAEAGSGIENPEIGPQKVDWAGNDFEWTEGERYGFDMSNCTDETYPDGGFFDNVHYSYYVARVSNGNGGYEFRWIINMCNREGREPRVEGHRPLAFRPAITNRVKVDWESNDLDWQIIDRYEGDENRYLFNFCDSTNVGEASYHVGNYQRAMQNLGDDDELIEFVLEPGSLENWYRSICRNTGFPIYTYDWIDTEYVGSAFRPIPQNATSLDERIASVTSLRDSLSALLEQVEALSNRERVPPATPEEYGNIQSALNALRATYRFSTSSEVSRVTNLSNRIDDELPELQALATNQCSNP
jgi:hypothetical protein